MVFANFGDELFEGHRIFVGGGVAGFVDVGNDDSVGLGEGVSKLFEESGRAAKLVRLKNGEDFFGWVELAEGAEGGTDFGWVVAVIVIDFCLSVASLDGAFVLEAAFGARKVIECHLGSGVRNFEESCDVVCERSVAAVVFAGNGEFYEWLHADRLDGRALDFHEEFFGGEIVFHIKNYPVFWHHFHVLDEGVVVVFLILVVVDVVEVDIGDNEDIGWNIEKGLLVLAGFQDGEVRVAEALVLAAELFHISTDDNRRIFAAHDQTGCDHSGRGGFSVGSRDAHTTLVVRVLSESFWVGQNLNSEFERLLKFRVRFRNGLRVNHLVNIGRDIFRLMLRVNTDALFSERLDFFRAALVRTEDGVTLTFEQSNESAHAASTGAYCKNFEMIFHNVLVDYCICMPYTSMLLCCHAI